MGAVILLWSATLFYALAESGRTLMGHQKLSTVGALIGQSPVTPTAASQAPGTTDIAQGNIADLTVRYASGQLGKPYQWAQPGNCSGNPASFDCSGLVRCAILYATAGGLNLPHNTVLQLSVLGRYRVKKKTPAAWQPGDLIYYFIPSEINQGEPAHVAIYIGGGKVIDAPHTGAKVQVDNFNLGRIMAVVRPGLWSAHKGLSK